MMRLYAEAECKVKSRKKVNCIAQTQASESMLSALKVNSTGADVRPIQ